MTEPITIRPTAESDRSWVRERLVEAWGDETVAVHGVLYRPIDLAGLVAESAGECLGLLTYDLAGKSCEIVTLNAFAPGRGAGAALVRAISRLAASAGCERLWLITTNDNESAIRFYLGRGFRVAAVHAGAVATARKLKPRIPLFGESGRGIVDEVEMEIGLGDLARGA